MQLSGSRQRGKAVQVTPRNVTAISVVQPIGRPTGAQDDQIDDPFGKNPDCAQRVFMLDEVVDYTELAFEFGL